MAKRKRFSILLRGDVGQSCEVWNEWTNYSITLFEKLGYDVTHIGVSGEKFATGKYVVFPRAKKRFATALKERSKFQNITFKCLPEDYGIAEFDFTFSMGRSIEQFGKPGYIYVSFPDNNQKWEVFSTTLYEQLESFIKVESAYLFEHSYREHILNVASLNENEFEYHDIIRRFR